jgi:hypothetical protein
MADARIRPRLVESSHGRLIPSERPPALWWGQRRKVAGMGDFLKALAVFAIAFVVFTFPATWLLMLFFGNLGLELSYIATLPLGILVSVVIGGATSRSW